MEIEFNKAPSKFLQPCLDALRSGYETLEAGGSVNIELESGGFSDSICILVDPDNLHTFSTDYESSDATWFPARIKALATAIRDSGLSGRFDVYHQDGMLRVKRS